MECAVGPVEDFDVDLVWTCGGAPVPCGDELRFAVFVLFGVAEAAGFGSEEGGFGVVDGLAIDREPLAHLLESLDLRCGDDALRIRADIQQIVAAFAGDVDQVTEEGFGGFEVGIEGFEAPGIVHGHASFPVAAGISLGWNELLRGFGVALVGSTETVVPDEIGVLVEEGDDLSCSGGRHVCRGGIEPDDGGEVAVVGEEFFELRNGLGVEVGVEVAVLCFVPVVGGWLMITGFIGLAARGGPILIL